MLCVFALIYTLNSSEYYHVPPFFVQLEVANAPSDVDHGTNQRRNAEIDLDCRYMPE